MSYKLMILVIAVIMMPVIFTGAIHNQLNKTSKKYDEVKSEVKILNYCTVKPIELSAPNEVSIPDVKANEIKIEAYNSFKDEQLHKKYLRQRIKEATIKLAQQETKQEAKTQTKTESEKSSTKEPSTKKIEVASRGEKRPVPSGNTSMKTYMSYKAITNKSSKQYKMQQSEGVYTDDEGFRKLGDRFMVAVGTYYGTVGTELIIELSSGTVFKAIIGDIKSNKHTDTTNRQHKIDGSVVEFIVDTKKLHPMIKKMGDCSYSELHNFKGNVVNITVLSN